MGKRLDEMRRALNNAPPKKPTTVRPTVPPKAKKPGDIPTVREVVIYQCGHPRPVNQMLAQPCPQCAAANRRERNQKQRAKYDERRKLLFPDNGRLPHGAEFSVGPYDAATQTWSGSLVIPEVGTFTGTESGVFALLKKLDQQYRAYLEDQLKKQAGGSGDGAAR